LGGDTHGDVWGDWGGIGVDSSDVDGLGSSQAGKDGQDGKKVHLSMFCVSEREAILRTNFTMWHEGLNKSGARALLFDMTDIQNTRDAISRVYL